MAIRLSGMVSGMDTDALVKEMLSAYSVKKDNTVKAQTKLSWKQDAWKELNAKIYNLYSKTISDMRYTTAYKKKVTTVSDPTKATVEAGSGSANGTQSLSITQLAKAGYLTGSQLSNGAKKIGSDTKLSELGVTGDSTFYVTSGGKDTAIKVNGDTTMAGVVESMKQAGVNANFDAVNQRIFVSAKESGDLQDFTLYSNDANGMQALKSLGLYTMDQGDVQEFETWANYSQTEIDAIIQERYKAGLTTADKEKTLLENTNKALASEKDAKTAQNESLGKANKKLDYQSRYANLSTNDAKAQRDAHTSELATLNDKVNGGGTLTETETARQKELETELFYMSEVDATMGNAVLTADDKQKYKDGLAKSLTDNTKTIADNTTRLATIHTEFTENEKIIAGTSTATSLEQIAADKNAIHLTKVTNETNERWGAAKDTMAKYNAFSTYEERIKNGDVLDATEQAEYDSLKSSFSFSAIKVQGQDSEIFLNGAKFTSNTNSISVNGLTVTAKELTGFNVDGTKKEISLNTSDDTQAVYDGIKNFITEYNKLINEMDKLYNASSSRGYEPLTSEEKEAMSEDEIKKWDEKIKDSLMRKDETMSSVSTAMKVAMSQSYMVDGKKYSLSSFGIETVAYFEAAENEKNAFHIAGDSADSISSGKADRLKSMIATDPDTVTSFFSQLTTGLYKDLDSKMKATELRSAYTVYNDKQMKDEYKDYTEEIKKWEVRLKEMEDKYYKQFSAMETALSKLQSSSSSLTQLLGN